MRDLDRAALHAMTRRISLNEVIGAGADIVAGRVRDRLAVEIAPGT